MQRAAVRPRYHARRAYVVGNIIKEQHRGNAIVIAVRIESKILVPFDHCPAARQLAVKLGVVKPQVLSKQIGYRLDHRPAMQYIEERLRDFFRRGHASQRGPVAAVPRLDVEARTTIEHFPEGPIVLPGFLDPLLMLQPQRFEIGWRINRLDQRHTFSPKLRLLCCA